ncbi:MAG: TauD/TfdA dioxygenase family protein [Burkholderiaceae bacterium]
MQLHTRPLDGPFGVEILDLDLSQPVAEPLAESLRSALAENAILLLRRQTLQPEDILRFTRLFGPLRVPLNDQYAIPGFEGLHRVSNVYEEGKPIGLPDAGVYWHSDGAYMETPDLCTLLYAVEVPRDEHGQPLGATVFASTELAYGALPDALRRRIDPLRGAFTVTLQYERKRRSGLLKRDGLTDEQLRHAPTRIHPIVRTHPVTGRKCIYASDGHTSHIVDLPEDESRSLLAELHRHVTDPRFRYTHCWSEGDLLLWDNRSTQHNATFDYRLPQRRVMYRTSCIGSVPF